MVSPFDMSFYINVNVRRGKYLVRKTFDGFSEILFLRERVRPIYCSLNYPSSLQWSDYSRATVAHMRRAIALHLAKQVALCPFQVFIHCPPLTSCQRQILSHVTDAPLNTYQVHIRAKERRRYSGHLPPKLRTNSWNRAVRQQGHATS